MLQLRDGAKTERALPANRPPPPLAWYTVTVATSNVRGAGTDSDVSVAFEGDAGASGKVPLRGGTAAFGRGARDKFR